MLTLSKRMSKLRLNKEGFTLTEVMIGIMILTVAIVSATSLLVGLMRINQNNLTTLQAYYFAQEGIEAVRNIRDTNWLHNLDWLGAESAQLWGTNFEIGKDYVVSSRPNPPGCGVVQNLAGLSNCSPWIISALSGDGEAIKIYKPGLGNGDEVETPFKRVISVKEYDCFNAGLCTEDETDEFVLVESKVMWNLGSDERELKLHEILTNWKGGAL